MRHSTASILHVYLQSAFLAGFAFCVGWIMTGKFDDDFARLIFASSLGSWVAEGQALRGSSSFKSNNLRSIEMALATRHLLCTSAVKPEIAAPGPISDTRAFH